jgi:hypothetical protein
MNWNELVLVADNIVTEFGQPITITKVTQGYYDTDTGMITSITVDTVTKGVIFDYGEKDFNGTSILRGDKKLLVKPSGITSITVNDLVTVGMNNYHIVSVKQTNPAGTNLLWELSIRGTQ